ncbi:response regulator transcription factor [Methylacidimicrobium sp. B4]|uniref:response regulator transcription factor n=1 Tax=Methylacidimicrobium sp. B4 TaxID=2796139 RepID=UPI001A90527F|nr:winged helix-turn-helix domain-containing protein [Methylacidimicrobium sp. B4]QSR84955.1 response regulator transcription factor [Methylacidimicrobium sp. B4]
MELVHQSPLPVVLLRWPTETRQETALLSRLRRLPWWVPIVALAERDEPEARREALERGADFLLSLRGSEEELRAILKSLGRRCGRSSAVAVDSLPLVLDRQKRLLRRGERAVVLTPTEFAIASYLFRHAGRIVLIEELAAQLRRRRPGKAASPRLLHAHLANLRRKLSHSVTGILLRPVRGKGLLLEWPPGSPRRA